MEKGEALNVRVWSLFERAGFRTEPSSTSKAEHHVEMGQSKRRKVDLYATDENLKVTIIGSNKSGGIKDSWTAHVNDWEIIGKRASADKVLLVITGKEVPPEDRAYACEKGMSVWSETELSYFEAIVGTIRHYAKFEIIHSLGIPTKEQKDTYKVIALKLKQPRPDSGHDLFLFTIPAEELLRTCAIYRRAQGNAAAYQRMLRRERLPKVLEFVTRKEAVVPTNLVVHLGEKVLVDDIPLKDVNDLQGRPLVFSHPHGFSLVALSIPKEYSSLELIDGQHRLFGFAGAEPATRATFDLLVTGLKSLDADKRQEIFVSINDNSRRMDPNLVAYLRYTTDLPRCQLDNSLMAIRVVVDLSDLSPFKNSIRLLDVGDQYITLKNFAGYDLKGLLGPRGILRRQYPNNDPAEFVNVLRTYFSTVRSIFKHEWNNPQTYIISTNRGIAAFLKLLRSLLRTEQRQLAHADFTKYLKALKSEFGTWRFEDLKKTYVGSQGWSEFHRDLVAAIRKKYPGFKR